MTYDAVIIGAGHNGLVTGCYLARAGLKVCIVEKNDWVGGAAVSRELYPGFTYSNCSYVASLFRPEIMRDLELPKYGLQILPYEGGAVFMGDGDYLGMFRDHDANRREFARHSRRDAKAYDRDSRDVLRFCRFIRPMLLRTPPDPSSFKPRDLAELMWLGRKMGEMSERQMAETVRFWTMSISDFLDEYFESPVIKGDMAVSAIIGTALGPMSPGSAYVLLHHYMGDVDGNVGAWGYARGGMGAITKALTQSFVASGGEVRAGNGVERIVVRGGRTTGVVLANGDEVKGKADFREFLRMVLINVYDVAQDELTDARLRGLLAFDATLGSWLGPRSPNSLILYLNRLAMGVSPLLPKGGMGALAAALAKAAVAAGVELRSAVPVAKVLIEGDRAVGVVLQGGEELRAGVVISAISPRLTFQQLVGPRHLDAGFYTRTHHIRSRGAAAKLHLALRGVPDFSGAELTSRLIIAPSDEAVELAFNPGKYGEVPAAPVMEIVVPSAFEAGMAPVGHHVLSAIVQYAPHNPKAGLEVARAEMLANTLAQLEIQAPGLRGMVAHAELLMPQDIEARFGMVGGNWHHGELAVEQMLFNRPLREAAQYATPLPGLWLAGAGSHPGGGINGAAGWNAAERILAEVRG